MATIQSQRPSSSGGGSSDEKRDLKAEGATLEKQDAFQILRNSEKGIGANGELEVKRDLKPRQISMIAIGGAIGTGLVIGTGGALAKAGPGSLLIGYSLMGATCFLVMCALGEMATYMPHKRGFAGHATRFVGQSFGFATGWNYLFKYLMISPNQLVASGLVIQYWRPDLSPAIFISVFIVVILGINFLGVKVFGEVEFWLSMIKIITLTGLILAGLIIDLGGSPSGDRIGFRYWQGGRAFLEYKSKGSLGRFLGFWSVMVNGLFAYMGTELVAITVGEARNPRKSVPKAIRSTFFRILFFYIFGVVIVGMVVAADSPLLLTANKQRLGAAASPFVVAIKAANIRVLPSIINACILIFTLSAANSDQYVASRTLYSLAMDGNAPAIFRRCNSMGVPYVALISTALFMALAYLTLSDGGAIVFGYFVSVVTIFGGLTWICILISHIQFMKGLKAQGMSRDDLPYKAPFQPYGSYIAVFFTSLVVFFKGWDSFMPAFQYKSFITNYIGFPIFFILLFGHMLIKHTSFIKPADIDLLTDAREFNEEDELAAKEDEEREEMIRRAPLHKKIWYKLQDW
ncbi:putative DIP5-glutamate and aspartate permease [Tilletiaria anomala UBC 951]|uniref:Putative DIP5-glutamate and aspartate permease n=1 Tax=Tilletiaria anomala (strain ATCC 24038 / CBS 436.72 / UBC 951) TaxID=1037660 RepID=A0A066WLZ1_TILAU|nr:putative DIP5-glutamate and aspartate permease [Tilletiaria anomala UBC 951]KDN53618.1 putative DIP5-glutamate and aspartate permease [Tilletiaria anomala UBC 951]